MTCACCQHDPGSGQSCRSSVYERDISIRSCDGNGEVEELRAILGSKPSAFCSMMETMGDRTGGGRDQWRHLDPYKSGGCCSVALLSKNLKVRIYKTVILPVVLYGCETWTLTLREELRLRVFEKKVLRKIFGAKRDEVTGEWRKLHNTELHALYSSPDIIRNIKSRRLRWAGHVARMGESRNGYRVVSPPGQQAAVGIPEPEIYVACHSAGAIDSCTAGSSDTPMRDLDNSLTSSSVNSTQLGQTAQIYVMETQAILAFS
ncbi:hypothetical protein ANN_10545 [Periplaneta americana]|uniref:Uncharacterized protein n=1 Tax=Periplaneta americana TaxID=6978 RepID=A0ABQ8TPJ1_PERAM|nr:hypothetical protein ANN_10545 [Periplaneta americana]